jgi:hypothetical protein
MILYFAEPMQRLASAALLSIAVVRASGVMLRSIVIEMLNRT